MIWPFMEIEKQVLEKYSMIEHLILVKIQNMMDINADLLQWFLNFLILTRSKTLATRATRSESAVKNENISSIRKSKLENNTNQLLENSRK